MVMNGTARRVQVITRAPAPRSFGPTHLLAWRRRGTLVLRGTEPFHDQASRYPRSPVASKLPGWANSPGAGGPSSCRRAPAARPAGPMRSPRRLRTRSTGCRIAWPAMSDCVSPACHGYCQMEPSILIEPDGVFYPHGGRSRDVARIVRAAAEGRRRRGPAVRRPSHRQARRPAGGPAVLPRPGSDTAWQTRKDRPDPNRQLHRKRRLCRAGPGPGAGPAGGGRPRGERLRPARQRRRGLPNRREVGDARPPAQRSRQVSRLQRRRGRPRRLHGPQRPGGQPTTA